MIVKVSIQRSQIHIYEIDGIKTLQFDVQFPEYPDLPTYGLTLTEPITVQRVKDIVIAKAQEVRFQMTIDEIIRDKLIDLTEFSVDIS